MITVLSLDIETNGYHDVKPVGIVEIGLILYKNGKISKILSSVFGDVEKISKHSSKCHGYKLSDLKGAPSFDEYKNRIQEMIDEADIILLHSRANDVKTLISNGISLKGKKVFDTEWYAKALKADLPGSLSKLHRLVSTSKLEPHKALNDALMTYEVYEALTRSEKFKKYRDDLDNNPSYKNMKKENYLFRY